MTAHNTFDEELPPLHNAARAGDVDGVKKALKHVIVGERDTWGETAMHWARTVEVASVLVSAGGEIDVVDPTGVSTITLLRNRICSFTNSCRTLRYIGHRKMDRHH